MTRASLSLLVSLGLAMVSGPAFAQVGVPDAFGLQGFIHTQSGASFDGAADVEVRIYDAETGGTLLYTETLSDVEVTGSRFSVLVGDGGTFPTATYTSVTELFSQLPEVYVAVAIDGNAELPRQRMMTAAFAFRAKVSDTAFGLVCSDCITTGHLSDGSVTAAKIGEACAEGEVLKVSGGAWTCAADDNTTDVQAGDGIAYSGGVVSLSAANCAAGEVLKRNAANTAWECATDAGAAGSVTQLSVGTGLTSNATTGEITVSLSPASGSQLGGVLGGQCPAGEVVAGYDASGGAICVQDADTTYTADGGLELTSGAFAIAEGGVNSARVEDGSLELDDLSDAAKSQIITRLVLNRNPGFEDDLDFWVEEGTSTVSPVIETDLAFVRSGSKSLKMDAVAAPDISLVATDEVYPVAEGSRVDISFWSLRTNYLQFSGAAPATLTVEFYDDAMAPVGAPVQHAWADGSDTEFVSTSLSATVPVGATWVGLSSAGIGDGNLGTIHLDDVTFTSFSPDATRLFVRTSGGHFTGNVTTSGDFAASGALSASSATISGALGAGSASVTGDISAGSFSTGGAVSAGSFVTSGAISAGSASVTGSVGAGSLNVSGNASVGGTLDVTDGALSNVRFLYMKDYDDDTGGSTDNKYRLLARDGAWQFYNGGVVVGNYPNGTWPDLPDGQLVVEDRIGVGVTSPEAAVHVPVTGTIKAKQFMADTICGAMNSNFDYGRAFLTTTQQTCAQRCAGISGYVTCVGLILINGSGTNTARANCSYLPTENYFTNSDNGNSTFCCCR